MDSGYGARTFKARLEDIIGGVMEVNKGYDPLDPAGSGIPINNRISVDYVKLYDHGSDDGVEVRVQERDSATTNVIHYRWIMDPDHSPHPMEIPGFGYPNSGKNTGLEIALDMHGKTTVSGQVDIGYHVEPYNQ